MAAPGAVLSVRGRRDGRSNLQLIYIRCEDYEVHFCDDSDGLPEYEVNFISNHKPSIRIKLTEAQRETFKLNWGISPFKIEVAMCRGVASDPRRMAWGDSC